MRGATIFEAFAVALADVGFAVYARLAPLQQWLVDLLPDA
jgi:hypothetical protein